MSTSTNRTIVVGVDGSSASLEALSWAGELVTAGGELHVVVAEHSPREGQELQRRWLTEERIGTIDPRLHVIEDRPARAVTALAEEVGADLVVVGVHGGLPGVPKAIGGVTHRLLRSSSCPIAVVRTAVAVAPDAPVVVGVGDGPATHAALSWSTRFATEDDRTIELVRAVNIRPLLGIDNAVEVMASYVDPTLLRQWAEEEVALVATTLREQGRAVATTVTTGRPGPALVKASAGARLLVVGRHLDGPITGYFAGVTLHHVLTHANCPVVVVGATRSEDDDRETEDETARVRRSERT